MAFGLSLAEVVNIVMALDAFLVCEACGGKFRLVFMFVVAVGLGLCCREVVYPGCNCKK